MTAYINPLDLKKIFLEIFLGAPQLLIFALTILISLASAKFGMSNKNFGIILLISSILFAVYLGEAIYFFILILIGFIIFKSLANAFR